MRFVLLLVKQQKNEMEPKQKKVNFLCLDPFHFSCFCLNSAVKSTRKFDDLHNIHIYIKKCEVVKKH